MTKRLLFIGIVLFMSATTRPLIAGEITEDGPWKTFSVNAGVFTSATETRIRRVTSALIYAGSRETSPTLYLKVGKLCVSTYICICAPVRQEDGHPTVQRLMGHKSLQSTMIYAHYQGGAREAVEILGVSMVDMSIGNEDESTIRAIG